MQEKQNQSCASAKTVSGLFWQRVQQTPRDIAYFTLDSRNNWQPTTWQQAGNEVSALSQTLKELGVKPGQHVGIMASTSRSWELVQLSIFAAGGVVVGIDPNDAKDNINLIMNRAQIKILVTQNTDLIALLDEKIKAGLQFIISIESHKESAHEKCFFLENLVDFNRQHSLPVKEAASRDAPASIIFTSGTTGVPKGICYTHGQLLLAVNSIVRAFPRMRAGSRMVCWLPLSNLFQRMINHCSMAINASTFFVSSPKEILKLLPGIKPDVFIGVPRFFEKFYEGLLLEIKKKPVYVRKLINLAFTVGDRHAALIQKNQPEPLVNKLLFNLLDPLINKKLRQHIGGNMKFLISGSAPMPVWLLERYRGMGLTILEAYGISENVVPMALNRPDSYKFGTAGQPLPENEIRLSEKNEIMVRGAGVCSRYLTGESEVLDIDENGFLNTGDLASIDEHGFITLKGRSTEMIKTSTGRRIAPAPIEDRLKKIDGVEQAVIFGDNMKYLIAVLSVRSREFIETQGKLLNANDHEPGQTINGLKNQLLREIKHLPSYQRPAGIIIAEKPFTVQGGELTANFKLRRKMIYEKFSTFIEEMYAALDKERHVAGGKTDINLMVIKA